MSLRDRLETQHLISPLTGWTGTVALVSPPTAPLRNRVAVYSALLSAGAITSFYFADDQGTPVSGTLFLAANTMFTIEQNSNTDPWFLTAPQRGLSLVILTGGPLYGDVYYLIVPGNY